MAALALLLAAPSSAQPHTFHPSAHPAEAVRDWQKHQHDLRFRKHVTPFYCSDEEMTFDGGWYAIPCVNVNAESGGRGGWTCNTYGVIDPTWFDYGGPYGGACGNSERTQSLIAAKIYREVGTAAWTPFEG